MRSTIPGVFQMRKWILSLCVFLALCTAAYAQNGVFAFEDAVYSVHVGKSIRPKTIAQGIEGSLTYTWLSSDEAVATVKNGVIKGISGGAATIVCTATDKDGNTFEAQTRVDVFVPITSVKAEQKSVVLAAPSEFGSRFSFKSGDQPEVAHQMHEPVLTFTPADASIQQLEWTSDDDMIACVTENGTIYGISVGTTTITGRAMDGSGKTVKIKVKVPECFVTEDEFVITEPEGAVLGYVRPRNFGNGSGIKTLNMRVKGDADVFAVEHLEDEDGLERIRIVPHKAGEAVLLFTCNGKTQGSVKIKVKHSAVYDNVSYPAVKISKLIASPESSIGTKTHVKCEIIRIVPSKKLGRDGGILYGKTTENGERQYVAFEYERALLCEVGDTQTIYGTVSEFISYETETGLTYTCPYFTGGHINR